MITIITCFIRKIQHISNTSPSKTLFPLGILDMRKDGVYFDGSNTTNRILHIVEEERPKIICIDELDKMPRKFQNQLLNFMESGRVKVDHQKKQYDFEIKGAKVFATCNEINRLSKPLQSRFRKLGVQPYGPVLHFISNDQAGGRVAYVNYQSQNYFSFDM